MEYKSYSTIFISFTIALFTIALALFFWKGGLWYLGIIPFGVITIALLILKTPIDQWGFQFQEVKVDENLLTAIRIEYPYLKTLSDEKQKEFDRRMFPFLWDRESYIVTEEPAKLDLYHKIMICTPGIILGIEAEFDCCDEIERIAAYKHAFPSPRMKFFHCMEYDPEDGVVIISIEQMVNSFRDPDNNYPVSYHVWSERFIAKKEGFPTISYKDTEQASTLFPFELKHIEVLLGQEIVDYRPLFLSAYYTQSEALKTNFPQLYSNIEIWLRKAK